MIEFYGAAFIGNLTVLILYERDLWTDLAILKVKDPLGDPTATEVHDLEMLLGPVQQGCVTIDLDVGARSLQLLRDRLSNHSLQPCNWQLIQSDLYHFFEFVTPELSQRRFVFVHPARQEFFEAPDPFEIGARLEAWPSTSQEIRAAANCFAVELHTATVFHLMRAVEIALRALAKERRVSVAKKRLEWQDWQTIIKSISDTVDRELANRNWRRGPGRDAFAEFYRGAVGSFHSFKDVYRNHVMHTRKRYEDRDAEDAMRDVGGFLRRLAPKLSESGTHIRWPR